MKAIAGFLLCALLFVAIGYGHDAALTDEGIAIQGYIGAAIPACVAMLSAALGALLCK